MKSAFEGVKVHVGVLEPTPNGRSRPTERIVAYQITKTKQNTFRIVISFRQPECRVFQKYLGTASSKQAAQKLGRKAVAYLKKNKKLVGLIIKQHMTKVAADKKAA